MVNLSTQRKVVENSLEAVLRGGDKWEPIAMEWFEKWKAYTDIEYDATPDEDLYPGPIDNSTIQGKFEGELCPGLVEGTHFVLIRKLAADALFSAYGGGPRFLRDVINFGTVYSPVYRVSLYRVRVEGYLCDSSNPTPDDSNPARHIVRYFEKTSAYRSVVDALIEGFNIHIYSNAVRCWIRDPEDDEAESSAVKMADTTLARDSPSHTTSEVVMDTISRAEGGEAKRARLGRTLTTDVTDRDGAWHYVRHDYTCSIRELLGNGESVCLILEVAPVRKPTSSEWPRSSILNKWKENLRVGDVFDAADISQGKWYNAVCKEALANGDVSVHFRGWAAKFDEVIPAVKVQTNIAALYTETLDRREWAVGDEVDFRVSPPEATSVWLKARVSAVDPASDRVQVTYTTAERDSALKKYGKRLSPPTIPANDDQAKQLGLAPLPAPLQPATVPAEESGDDDVQYTWCDIQGEDICPVYTHTKKAITPAKSTALAEVASPSNPHSYSSSISSALSYITKPFSSSSGGRFDYSEKHVKGTTEVAGAVGLQNLGNTCFMNSILQCVSNTEAITRLFLDDAYKAQLNSDNPLGHGGKLAVAYAKLIKDMWSNAYSKIIPRDFKYTIGEFQPQFAGYDQQDSQEFLGFLLDGLHEDLNRVVKKPHVTKIESKGRPDVVIASESWRRYLLRNDSELVDRCFGQLKSHVTCTNCGNESVTFDEYSSLSLPIPVRNTRPVSVTVQLLPLGSQPVKIELEVEITATMKQLEKILIDRLVAHKLLNIGHAHQSSASMDQTTPADSAHGSQGFPDTSGDQSMETEDPSTRTGGSKASSPHAEDGLEGFEMVNRPLPAGIATLSDADAAYVTVQSGEQMDESRTSGACSPASTTSYEPASTGRERAPLQLKIETPVTTSSESPAAGGPYFHFGTLFPARPSSILKHYHAAEAGATAVLTFVGKHDSLMAFQLEHWAPEHRTVSHHSSYLSSRIAAPQYDAADAECGYVAVDVCMGSKVTSTYSSYERIELGGYPFQLSLPVGCTNRYVHTKIWAIARRFLREDSPFCSSGLDELPYAVVVTGSYAGSASRRTIAVDAEVFEAPQGGNEMLVVLWPAKFEEHVDEDQISAVRTISEEATAPAASAKSGAGLSIYQCFDKFIEREQLAEAETLYCGRCKQHLAPIKKMDLWAAPDILVVQLKRFQYIPGQYFVHREKISDVVDFPIEGLDLSKYVIGPQHPEAPPVYDLYAVSQHMGGLGGGHYTATCKNFMNNKWYDFNDSSVSGTSPERAVSGSAYVLFYKRRTGSLKWAGITPSSTPMPDEL